MVYNSLCLKQTASRDSPIRSDPTYNQLFVLLVHIFFLCRSIKRSRRSSSVLGPRVTLVSISNLGDIEATGLPHRSCESQTLPIPTLFLLLSSPHPISAITSFPSFPSLPVVNVTPPGSRGPRLAPRDPRPCLGLQIACCAWDCEGVQVFGELGVFEDFGDDVCERWVRGGKGRGGGGGEERRGDERKERGTHGISFSLSLLPFPCNATCRSLRSLSPDVVSYGAIFETGGFRSHVNTKPQRTSLPTSTPRGFPTQQLTFQTAQITRRTDVSPNDPLANSTSDKIAVEIVFHSSLSTQEKSQHKVLLMFFGGGYALGSPADIRDHNIAIALRAKCICFAPMYRLAPAEPAPGAMNDAVSTYRWLLDEQGYNPSQIVLGGYSAGGNLAFVTALYLAQHKLPLPAGVSGWTPWVDLTNHSSSTRLMQECILPGEPKSTIGIERGKESNYATYETLNSPLISPLYATVESFAEMKSTTSFWIEIGSSDRLRDEVSSFSYSSKKPGVV